MPAANPIPPVSTAAPFTSSIAAPTTKKGGATDLVASLTSGIGGIASGLASGLGSGLLGDALASAPMNAESGGSYVAGGPTIGAKIVGGKGVSAGTAATQDATASRDNMPFVSPPGVAQTNWNPVTLAALAVAAFALFALVFSRSRKG